MSVGQGSILVQQKQAGGGGSGPPFALNSADNGLQVDPVTGHIVLGQDIGGGLAGLLSGREIPLNNFPFHMDNAGGHWLSLDPTFPRVQLGDFGGFSIGILSLTPTGFGLQSPALGANVEITGESQPGTINRIRLGDPTASLNFTFLEVDDFNQVLNYQKNVNKRYMSLNIVNGQYQLGDIDGSASGMNITVDDTTGSLTILNTAFNSFVTINGVSGFTGTVTPVTAITVNGGIVTNVT